jgi:hypothetical protein
LEHAFANRLLVSKDAEEMIKVSCHRHGLV